MAKIVKRELQELNIPGVRKLKGGEIIPDNILKKIKEFKLDGFIEDDSKIESKDAKKEGAINNELN